MLVHSNCSVKGVIIAMPLENRDNIALVSSPLGDRLSNS